MGHGALSASHSVRFCSIPAARPCSSTALPIAIGGRALALLRALVEARGQVVAKSALMDAAWPNTSVEESNLTVQIAALRRRLRVSPEGEDWIATFPRVGYRFAGPLSVEEYEAPTIHARPPALGPKPSIAVLPFTSMSGDPEQAHFADGLAEDLATDLSKVPGLLVIPRNSSFFGTAGPTDIRSVTRELGVRYVIGGSVRRAAGRVRIGVQLTEPAMNRHLWAERFDGDLADVFPLQDEVVGKIVAALANVLPLAPPATRRRTTDIEAHDFLVRGRVLLMHSPSGNNLARTLLAQAIALDPASAEAHACLAISHYGAAVNYGEAAEANRVLGLACARKAVSLDQNDPWPIGRLGTFELYAGELEEAEAELQTALRIKPNHRRHPREHGRFEDSPGSARGCRHVGREGAAPQPLSSWLVLLDPRLRVLRRRSLCRGGGRSPQGGGGSVAGEAHPCREPGTARADGRGPRGGPPVPRDKPWLPGMPLGGDAAVQPQRGSAALRRRIPQGRFAKVRLVDQLQRLVPAFGGGDMASGSAVQTKRLGVLVVLGEVAVDGGLEVDQ